MSKQVVFVFPIIRTDYIKKSLQTLHKYTKDVEFDVVVVDQSIEGIDDETKKLVTDYVKIKNEGFSRASNIGIIRALRKYQYPYIAVVNDDTEMIHQGWFTDALEEFKTDDKIVAVCPESPRVAMWGYGLTDGEHLDILPHKDEYTPEDIAYLKQGDYDKEEIQKRHNFTIPESFPFTKRGVVDGIAMWMPIFKREALIELGLFEERFVWGGGEDYDMLARAYSCAWPEERDVCDEKYHRRMVSTMKSWVWHHWGQSKDVKETLDPELFAHKEPWNDLSALWKRETNNGFDFDCWGHYEDENGIRRPLKRIPDIKVEPL